MDESTELLKQFVEEKIEETRKAISESGRNCLGQDNYRYHHGKLMAYTIVLDYIEKGSR